ncbi:uncharacterized protein [Macrobrachium rosenbergii]|uniref:uncharacterized protein n=1 Tax=Macrobrachium rosenbergii TaxID=79674 RepID=UPI0034D5DE49
MKLLAILAVTIAVAAATTIPLKTQNESDVLYSAPVSASIGEVDIPAIVQEVNEDWPNTEPPTSTDDDENDEADDEGEDAEPLNDDEEVEGDENDDSTTEDEDLDVAGDEEETENVDNEDEEAYVDEGDDDSDLDDDDEVPHSATQEEFEANVPSAIHGGKDVIIHKDNFIPILKTIVLAYTRKEKPSYSDILKAGGISAFKTGFKYLGKENLGENLLQMAKKLTGAFEGPDADDLDTELLAEMAESYLSSHRFKLVLPESVLLHQKEMEEFLDKRPLDQIEGRSLVTSRQFEIAMPRADPAVQTILTIGPMTWMALIGGLFSIPYFFSGSDEPEFERVDHYIPNPSPYLRPPKLPFFNPHHLRRDETEHVPHQQIDQEYQEYQKSYSEWYNNWYLRYKNYYDEHYPNHERPLAAPTVPEQPVQHQPVQHQPVQHQSVPRQPLPHQPVPHQPVPHHPIPHQPTIQVQPSSLDVMVPPPPLRERAKAVPEKPLHPPTKPLPAKQRLPKQPPPIVFPNPLRPPAPADVPRLDSGRNSGANIISTFESKPNTFGTFQSEENKGDSHFKVIQGSDVPSQTTRPGPPQATGVPTSPRPSVATPAPRSRVPSPRPVYIPTTEVPKTESGFKPITKPNSSTANPSTTPSSNDRSEFKPPREESLLSAESSPKPQSSNAPDALGKTAGGFKPIASPAAESAVVAPKKEPETSTIRVSAVTSGVFKTTAGPTPAPATTPVAIVTSRPAVFVRTATQKSVRVVTSSSFVVPNAPETKEDSLRELKRPQRHQQSSPSQQQISNQVKTQQPLPVHQPLPLEQTAPAAPPPPTPPAVQKAPLVQYSVQAAPQQPQPAVQQQPQPRPAAQQPTGPVIQPAVSLLQPQKQAAQQQAAILQQQAALAQQQQVALAKQQQAVLAQQQQQQAAALAQQQQRPVIQPAIQEFPNQQALVANQDGGFVRTNIPTNIKVVDHRPAQGFGLGPKPATEPTTTPTTTTPMPIYALDPFYGSRLSRIDVIFHQLGVQEEGCREQVVCNIYKNPDVYTPYSDFLSRQLTVKLEELQRPKVSDERILRFFRYLKAAREGQDGSDCNAKYPECDIDTTQLSHKPIMNAFQKVSLLMNAASS